MGEKRVKKAFIKKISYVIHHRGGDFREFETATKMKLFTKGGTTTVLINEPARVYAEVIDGLLQFHNWSNKFSEKYLDDELQKLITDVVREMSERKAVEGRVTYYFDKLVDRLDDYSVENIVIMPITGFNESRVSADERVTIGDVVLVYMDDVRMRETIDELENLRAKASRKEPEKEQLMDVVHNSSLESIKDHVCAEYRVLAEPGRAVERAYDSIRRALDWLRYISFFRYPRDQSKKMAAGLGLLGEVITLTNEISIIRSSPPDIVTYHHAKKGPLVRFDWNTKNIEALQASGFISMAELLKSAELTEFQQALLLGVHWFSDSLAQLEKENELLSLITCLESVIPGKDGFDKRGNKEGIKGAVAESVATIHAVNLPPGQKNVEGIRGETKNDVLKMYSKRNTITHGGRIEILEEALEDFSSLVGMLLLWLIECYQSEEFTDAKTLFKWLQLNKSTSAYERLKNRLKGLL
jgi:Apea-like HEPN